MKSTKDLKKREGDSRYYDGMSVVKWLDIKLVMMISTIYNAVVDIVITDLKSNHFTTNMSTSRNKKTPREEVDGKVPAMVQRYKYMKESDLLN